MPRLFRRLSLFFAVLALGTLAALWVGARVVAERLVDEKTEPVRRQFLADWAANEAQFAADLEASAAFNVTQERTPASLGCELTWAGDGAALAQHLARCDHRGAPLPRELVSALEKAGDDLLRDPAKAPTFERDLGWMQALRGRDDWSQAAGTPLEFFDFSAAGPSVLEVPVLDAPQLQALAALRLLEGQRAPGLEDAVLDVTALGRALLGRPVLVDQLVGLRVLQRLRGVLVAAGRPELAPSQAALDALRGSRLAAGLLFSPWVPPALRARFFPTLSAASRCAAFGNATLFLEVGELLDEHYPAYRPALAAGRPGACASDFIARGLDGRAAMAPGAWARALRVAARDPGDPDAVGPSLMTRAARSSSVTRGAALETFLTLVASKPFPAQQP